MSEDNETVLIE